MVRRVRGAAAAQPAQASPSGVPGPATTARQDTLNPASPPPARPLTTPTSPRLQRSMPQSTSTGGDFNIKSCQWRNSYCGGKINGIVQDCSISSADALEIQQSCAKRMRWSHINLSRPVGINLQEILFWIWPPGYNYFSKTPHLLLKIKASLHTSRSQHGSHN